MIPNQNENLDRMLHTVTELTALLYTLTLNGEGELLLSSFQLGCWKLRFCSKPVPCMHCRNIDVMKLDTFLVYS